ncbi:MAG: hypothetical protein JRJ44_02665 [Deltaproteobacteria bacterium]|nr:hypothetical protein [Deltaproteobacteria bacterium]
MKKQKSKKTATNIILIIIIFLFCGFYLKKACEASDAINPEKTKGFVYYKQNVAPILAKTCSSKDENGVYVCHGKSGAEAEKEEYAKFHNAPYQNSQYCQTCHTQKKGKFSFILDSQGKISTSAQYILSYIEAKKKAVHNKIPFAKILRMPLVGQAGGFGLYHKGGEIFNGTSDPQYKKLAEWVRLENEDIKKVLAQNKTEQFFAKKVLPAYARNSCFNPSCHIFNHSSFLPDAGMETEDLNTKIENRFSLEQIRFNRMTSKGLIQHNVYLTGDVEQSRILKKNIPINQGGVLHRGGNDQFFTGPDDPDYKILKEWLMMEREDAVSKLKTNGKKIKPSMVGKLQGIVFVRTKTKNYRKYLDVGKYMPGADLYLLKLKEGETLQNTTSKPINLTARFRKGKEADIREPDIRYDGQAILFVMRIGEADNLNIYELTADSNLDFSKGTLRKLTYGHKYINGIKIHYTDPTYVPDPADKNAAAGGYNLDKADIVFASNISGYMVQSEERGIVGEADAGDTTTIIDFDRPETDNTFVGKRIYIVDGTNKGERRTIIDFKNRLFTQEKRSYITVDRPFAKPIDNSTIYVIERDKNSQPGFLPSYSVYGIKYPEPLQEKENYNQTLSRITYGIAQELDISVRTTGEVFFTGQRSFTDKYDRPIFHLTSCRRHLDTRFSFPTHQGNRSEVIIYADNYEMPSGIDIHVGMEPRNLWEGGNLNVSDHQMGPGLEARNPNDFSTGYFDENKMPVTENVKISNTRYNFKNKKQPSHTRFIFKKISLFPLRGPNAVSRTGYSPGGVFKDSTPLPNGDILVSHSDKPINNLNPKANPDFDLYIIKPDPSFHSEGGKTNPKVKKVKIAAASKAGTSEVQAYPLYIRLKPKINAAKRPKKEHLIGPAGKPEDSRPAVYLERNYLLIDAIMDNPSPVGKNTAYPANPMTGAKIAPIDEVKYVRMIEVMPTKPDLAKKVDTNKIKNKDPQSTQFAKPPLKATAQYT